jgi:hypothetical protein
MFGRIACARGRRVTLSPAELVPDPSRASEMLALLWVSCGDEDGLLNIS